jgi:hypothetical protein
MAIDYYISEDSTALLLASILTATSMWARLLRVEWLLLPRQLLCASELVWLLVAVRR